MKIKKFFLSGLILSLFVLTMFAQDNRAAVATEKALPHSIVEVAEMPDTTTVTFEELVNQVIQAVTNSEAEITIPGKFNPTDSQNVMSWWWFIYGLVAPIGLFLISKFWPATKKPELILRSTAIGIVVLLIIVFSKGASVIVIGQAVMAFVLQTFTYDKLYNPLGMKSVRTANYK